MLMRFGVDEAGKGPVLGSMFAAAVVADPETLPDDVGDSKDIPPERRATLETEIRDCADAVAIAEIPVSRIDDPETDMNSLTVDAHASALAEVVEAIDAAATTGSPRSDSAIPGTVDAGDTDAERFGRRVADGVNARLDVTPSVTAEHGADATNSLVGAASIVAKEAREAHVADLADEFGAVGSGYPSDPTTRAFLEDWVDDHGALPACARESWGTSRDVLAAGEQVSLDEF